MARSKKMVVSEESTDKNDAIAQVMGAGLDVLVQHNAHLIKVDAHKDELLMKVANQGQEQMVQFARLQTTMIEKFSEMVDSIQKLKDREYEREEKREEAKFMRQLKEKGYTDVRQLATIALNQFSGRTMLKESERGLVAEFVESLDDEQVTEFTQKLRPGQLAAFAKIIDALKTQEDKENAAPNGKDPEADNARH